MSSGRTVVGDGGAGWRLKALKRMQERCREEGKSLRQLATERGMDLDALERPIDHRRRSIDHRRLHLDDRRTMRRPQLDRSMFLKREDRKHKQTIEPTTVNRFPNDGSFMETFSQMTNSEMKIEATQLDVPECNDMPMTNISVAEQLRTQLATGQSLQNASQSRAETSTLRSIKNRGDVLPSSRRRRDIDIDSNIDISEMYKRTKIGDDRDIDDVLADNIVRHRRFDRHDLDADDVDVDTNFFTAKHKKHRKHERRHRRGDRRHRMETVQENCRDCFDGHDMPKHLIISIANASYLRLPETAPLVAGHCLILPAEHLPTTREADDHLWIEIRNFKKALIQMHHSKGKDVIFLETAVRLRDRRRHARVECIPVEHDVAQKAPVYFKKAIDDATEDWSQHHFKRCIDTAAKGLRGSIPEHFPYFHVEFNLQSGFVHVIDDENGFDENLGRKVLMGLMHLPAEDMYKRTHRTSIEEQKQSVEAFLKQWHPYDWTRQL